MLSPNFVAILNRQTQRRPETTHVAPDEREADERFVAWVLGYGYAAGHWDAAASQAEPQRARQLQGSAA